MASPRSWGLPCMAEQAERSCSICDATEGSHKNAGMDIAIIHTTMMYIVLMAVMSHFIIDHAMF
jgi:hypothetical protein